MAKTAAIKVLVAEDVDANRELLQLFLEGEGFHVDVVGDGVAAVAAVRTTAYDVVLMDLQMPELDGLEATRAIRQAGGRLAHLPIIGLSASVMPDDVTRCLAAGMNDHLSKPFTIDGLIAVITLWAPPRVAGGAGDDR